MRTRPFILLVCLGCLLIVFVLGTSTQQYGKGYFRDEKVLSTLQPRHAMPGYKLFSEWSYPLLRQQHMNRLEAQTYPTLDSGNVSTEPNILFVDGREECNRMHAFMIKVRQSGYLGLVVLLVYYREDVSNCQSFALSFSPLEVFYFPAPMYEQTLLQYHGVTGYFKANPDALVQYKKAAVVKPDEVVWCVNPFLDVPLPPSDYDKSWDHALNTRPTDLTVYAVIGAQSDIGNSKDSSYSIFNYDVSPDPKSCEHSILPSGQGRVIDHFMAGTPKSLNAYMATLLRHASSQPPSNPQASFVHAESTEVAEYVRSHVRQLEPRDRYAVAQCKYYLIDDNSTCLSCRRGTHTLITGTSRCLRKADGRIPNYTPYCKEPYRYPVMEVPTNMTLQDYASEDVMDAARRLRTKGLFEEAPTNFTATASERCPNGQLGIITMMTGYHMSQVRGFVGSFISHSDPHCTVMIAIVNPGDGLEGIAELYPNRVEVVLMIKTSEYYPRDLKHCPSADRRFGVVLRWLSKHHRRFRYIMSIDSRDYLFLADPYAQLLRVLSESGHSQHDFVSAVSEAYPAGGSTHPHYLVSHYVKKWVQSCGDKCYERIARSTFVNGEPLSVINSGHIIGTSIGLLHYYRFHVNMMKETGLRCGIVGEDQGRFTFYMYGMLQEAHYPHKILVLSSSRSGFANMPLPYRISRKEVNYLGAYKTEYNIVDCNENIIAGLHQFDRYKDFKLLEQNTAMSAPWRRLLDDGTFGKFFQRKLEWWWPLYK